MRQVGELQRAGTKAKTGSIEAGVEVTWEFVVTAKCDEKALATLDEQALRETLGDRVEELLGQLCAKYGIEIGKVLEVNDTATSSAKVAVLCRQGDDGTRQARVSRAIQKLREARELLKAAGASRAVEKVRRALTSAGGAERHACAKDCRAVRQN